MRLYISAFVALPALLLQSACARPDPPTVRAASASVAKATPALHREIRITGSIEAIHSSKIVVPRIYGQGGALTLTSFIANGSHVHQGDLIATFDATQQVDNVRDAQAKFDDLGHQVDQKRAQNHADAEKRASDLQQAEADLAKAEFELKKGPILSEIDRLKNEQRAAIARLHVNSLKRSNAFHDQADAAALRYLELQHERQQVTLERYQNNIRSLEIRAPLAGMVAHEMIYRNNSLTHAQEGDELYRGQPLVSIFDPTEMVVRCTVEEPDDVALAARATASVYLDAYPDLVLPAHLESASPVASSALGSPIKTFIALFKIDKTDPRILPDLSAAVVIQPAAPSAAGGAE